MLKREAKQITGGLSAPGKMPEGAWSISAYDCNIGSILRKIQTTLGRDTVCSKCYALARRYLFPAVQKALDRRLEALKDPRWADAMVVLITGKKHFRWFDSGDIQGDDHLELILEVVTRTPDTMHWLPTREYLVISRYLRSSGDTQWQTYGVPPNLCIRLSNQWIDGVTGNMADSGVEDIDVQLQPLNTLPWSVVKRNKDYPDGYHCPAHDQGNKCGECRACWDQSVKLIVYPEN